MNIVHSMLAADYHAHPALSKSVLDKVARSPLHARAYLDGEREEPTKAMEFGTAFHAAVLEPERFADAYAVFTGDRRTKEGKAAYQALLDRGAQVVDQDDYDRICEMSAAVRAHPTAGALLQPGSGVAEASVFWQATEQVECKCRPDFWRVEERVVVDIKTTDDASPAAFAGSVINYRYHVQAAHYLKGTGARQFIFVVVEKKAPYAIAVYELDAAALELGAQLRERDIERFATCTEFGIWPGYDADITTLSLPAWAGKEIDL